MTNGSDQLDQLNIETPEQVDLRFPIAGIGSRFLAVLTDTALQVFAQIVLYLLLFVLILGAAQRGRFGDVSDTGGKWMVAAIVLFNFLLYWGYFSLFEAYWNGQTPGKRLVKIRVIKDSGRQITLFEALARNLLRVIDALPGIYLVGVVTMLCNRQQKRLGDFVAATLVVHERTGEAPVSSHGSRGITASSFPPPQPEFVPRNGLVALPADAVARLGAEDLNVIESFFARALDFDLTTRAEIAGRIAASMFAKMGVAMPQGANPERALEAVAFAMRGAGRR